ncbi:MAG: YbhB/YbcL family Raf kinase inhibitor-like protein [Candidatus Thorarchaeota archaeon]
MSIFGIVLLLNDDSDTSTSDFSLASPAFDHGGSIPSKYTCDGEDINPRLEISGIPNNTQSLALVMDDPDAVQVAGHVWDHWVLWNISPSTTVIEENSVPAHAVQGRNSWGRNDYGGPCPPSGTHRYFFKLYALDAKLDLPSSATKLDLEQAMEGHILAQARLMGTYQKI